MVRAVGDMVGFARQTFAWILPATQLTSPHQMELVQSVFKDPNSIRELANQLRYEIASPAHIDKFPTSINTQYIVEMVSAIAINWFSAADLSTISRQMAAYLQRQQVMRRNFRDLFVLLLRLIEADQSISINSNAHQALKEFFDILTDEMVASTHISWMFPPG